MIAKTELRVFVAWPFDVKKERDRAETVIKELDKIFRQRGFNLEMLDWFKSVAPGAGNPEDIIIKTTKPQSWDIFIGILWKRFGSLPHSEDPPINPRTERPYDSGFEFEYELAYELWKKKDRPHIMIYKCDRLVSQDEHDPAQFNLLKSFIDGIVRRKEALFKKYDSVNDFGKKLKDDLASVIERLIAQPIPPQIVELSKREYELSGIQTLLLKHPETSIVVCASTGKGKSWLMEKLGDVLQDEKNGTSTSIESLRATATGALQDEKIGASAPSFFCLKLDCRKEIGINASLQEMLQCIYRQLLQREPVLENPKDLLQAISHHVGTTLVSKRKRLIFLLDNVEFLHEECRVYLKDMLLPELWKVTGNSVYYPNIIAFCRFHPVEWNNGGLVRFETMELLPFRQADIEVMLRQKTKELPSSDPVYFSWASKIMQISHGHASCILNLVASISDNPFIQPADLESAETFMNFANPVIDEEILNDDNLAPFEPIAKKIDSAKRLRKILPYICLFRFYSLAQLRILAYYGVIASEEVEDVIHLLNRTLLFDISIPQARWKSPESLRRLLADALYHQNQEEFNKLNRFVCECYDAWITGEGREELLNLSDEIVKDHIQIYYIVEAIYHHSLTKKGLDLVARLKEITENYLSHLRGNYPRKYLIETLIRYMRGDAELAQNVRWQSRKDEHPVVDDYHELVSFIEGKL